MSTSVPIRCLLLVFAFILPLTACREGAAAKERPVPDLSQIKANLAFKCAYEKDAIPPRDAEADQLYKHARWLRKNNLLKEDPSVYPKIERLIRIATAYGHDKANLELRQMIGKGQAESDDPVKESLDLTEDLIKRGIPGGYYDMGRYLEKGYGVKQDAELALKYFRKSADLGSPEGQFLLGEKLAPIDIAPDIARQMRRCAVEQGHGEAGSALGIDHKIDKQYPEALVAFQLGAKAGDSSAAFALQHGFDGPPPENELIYLGQQKDPERVRRYKIIEKVLSDYSYLNPKVPEIDKIVPLPPAKLPPWDGKLQWLEEHKANLPPPLPTEERITEMARAKGLDPMTGRHPATGIRP
jgi:TPR repeat protein